MRKGFIWLIALLLLALVVLAAAPLLGMIFGGGFDP